MTGISVSQALGIIGNSPILKNALGHTIDKLKIPRHLDIGNVPGMSAILSSVMSGGIGSLLQSPLGSALAPLTSMLGQAESAVTSALGADGSPFTAALSSLSSSATTLSGLADNLVGFASNAGLPGQLDLIAHMGILSSLATGAPAGLSMATVLAPTTSSALLSAAENNAAPIVSQVVAGTLAPADGASQIAAIQATLDSVTTASTGALATSSAAALSLSAAQSAVALLVAGSPEVVAAMTEAIRPDMLATVQTTVAAHEASLLVAPS